MGEEKYTHKCPTDGKKYNHPGKCPDHPEIDLILIEEEESVETVEEDDM